MVSKDSKVVVITGGTAGIGRAAAQRFARDGDRIVLLARGSDRFEPAVKELKNLGGDAIAVQTDVADPDQVEAAAVKAEETFGPIDIWINDAMTTVFAPFKDMQPDEFRRVTEVTYLGVVYGTMAALKRMIPRDRGTVIQVGSALADRSIPLQSAYCGAKHGIRGFTDSIRCELIHDKSNVYITMVQMPALNTPQFRWCKSKMPKKAQPVPPIFQPEVAAEAIHYAAYHRKRELYVGLPTIEAMWGNKFIPGYLDRMLAKSNYKAQQIDEPEDPDRPYNLFEPVAGADIGAHGAYDNKARPKSKALWASEHIGIMKLLFFAIGALVLIALGILIALIIWV